MLAAARPAGMAAEVRRITLDEAILTARSHSVDAAVALNELPTGHTAPIAPNFCRKSTSAPQLPAIGKATAAISSTTARSHLSATTIWK